MEMMEIPMNQLPELAVDFLRKTSKEVGYCGEVCLTCFAAYAQCVENLPCEDDLYKASKEDRAWFKEQVNDRHLSEASQKVAAWDDSANEQLPDASID